MSNKNNHDIREAISPSEAGQKAYEHLGSNASCELNFKEDRVRSVSEDGTKQVLFHDSDEEKSGPHIHVREPGADGSSPDAKDVVYPINK